MDLEHNPNLLLPNNVGLDDSTRHGQSPVQLQSQSMTFVAGPALTPHAQEIETEFQADTQSRPIDGQTEPDTETGSETATETKGQAMKNTWLSANDTSHSLVPTLDAPTTSSNMSKPTTLAESTKKPLGLLDLPVDILKDIVKEVTHTNDLTCLALCHSALHRLVIPHIYSRFDIVWPDSATPAEPRTGVDALTYGLATLVMAEDVFGEPRTNQTQTSPVSDSFIRRRRGNYYAHFTRKFSLGNGPPEWVQEYLISKEGGKMLGTLVALALARMRNLDTFIWDMPTGILRDVWMALSSLDDRNDNLPCRLDRVAVRFHDNSLEPHALPLHHPPPPGSIHPPLDHVEHPSFSVLPPLKSLSVLDIDEIQYLDEMSVLIGRSTTKLRELRVGIARHIEADWAQVWEGDQLHQIDKDHPTASCLTIGPKRLGGVLGVLTAFVSDMRRTYSLPHRPKRLRRRSNATVAPPHQNHQTANITSSSVTDTTVNETTEQSPNHTPLSAADIALPITPPGDAVEPASEISASPKSSPPGPDQLVEITAINSNSLPPSNENSQAGTSEVPNAQPPGETASLEEEDVKLSGKLALETLELERVPLSIPVLQTVIDWGKLTSLTLLQCPNQEHLWKTLRRLYSPVVSNSRHYATTDPSRSKQKSSRPQAANSDYRLKLTKLHTDTASPSLISFIRETLPPNSLEVVFLQETSRTDHMAVSIDSIFRNVLRKHRTSLKKILIDSSERGPEGQSMSNSRSKRWMLNREMLDFVMNGKMPALRELGITIDYRDWVSSHNPFLSATLLKCPAALLFAASSLNTAPALSVYPIHGQLHPRWVHIRTSRTGAADCRYCCVASRH